MIFGVILDHNNSMDFLLIGKFFIQIGLIVFFLYFFGVPSIIRYLERQVLTVSSKRYPPLVLPPSITVVTFNSTFGGWKHPVPTSTSFDGLKRVCGEARNVTACIVENTRSLEEMIFVELGFEQNASLMSDSLWQEDFTVPWYGRSYTLNYPEPRGTDWRTDAINIHINQSDGLTRRIFFHDPDYFLLSVNPLALPINLQTLKSTLTGRVYYSLALTEHVELSTPQDPCVDDPSYSFHSCVKESLAKNASCRLPWDEHSSGNRRVCSTIQEFEPFARSYEFLKDTSKREILKMTGCHKPCHFREYVVVNGPLDSAYQDPNYHLTIEVWMLTTEVTVETEMPLYSWKDLVADFGGTLSLLLGVSFMTLWDGVARLKYFGTVAKNYFA